MLTLCHFLIANPRHIFFYDYLGGMADDSGAPSAQVPSPEDRQPLLQGDGSTATPPSDSEADVQGSSTTTTSSTVGTMLLDAQASDQLPLQDDGNDQSTTPVLPSPLPSSTLTSLGQAQPQDPPCPNNGLSAGAALVALPGSGEEEQEGRRRSPSPTTSTRERLR